MLLYHEFLDEEGALPKKYIHISLQIIVSMLLREYEDDELLIQQKSMRKSSRNMKNS